MRFQEELGRPFRIELDILSEDFGVNFSQIVGHEVTIRATGHLGHERFWHGVVAQFAWRGKEGGFARYAATVVPRFWVASRTTDCRIFQNESVPDIVSKVLKEHAVEFRPRLSASYPAWEYCVQYCESDMDFVQRLLEHEGIYYFFDHADGKHTMVLCDSPDGHLDATHTPELIYHDTDDDAGRERVRDWTVTQLLQPTKLALKDYDFKAPGKNLLLDANQSRKHAHAGLEVYDFPGKYIDPGEGERYTKVRLQEIQCQHEVARASGEILDVVVGRKFKLKDHPRSDQNRSHLVTSLEFEFRSDAFGSSGGGGGGGGGGGRSLYRSSFTCIPSTTFFRPTRVTRKPVIPGPQTAHVVGAPGKEIEVDEHARVKVQFHWDRYGKFDDNSSCWMRVSQPWAGKGYGGMNIPRVGVEVIVEFIDGDPDRPIITGRVYNGKTMPYGSQSGVHEQKRMKQKNQLAAAQAVIATARAATASVAAGDSAGARVSSVFSAMQSAAPIALKALSLLGQKFDSGTISEAVGIVQAAKLTSFKSNSTEGTGGSNEITMDDAAGAEALFMKAQKDEIHNVGNDMIISVLNDMIVEVYGNRLSNIHGNDTLIIDKDMTTTVSQKYYLSVTEDATTKINGSTQTLIGDKQELAIKATSDVTIGDDSKVVVQKKQDTHIGSDSKLTIDANQEMLIKGNQKSEIQKDQTILIKGLEKIDIEKTATITVTDAIKVEGKKTIECKGADEIKFECGPCSITMKNSGEIEIKATNIKIVATAQLDNSGATINSIATAIHKIEGTPVMINC
jgi:type VI secretion system secreted protein VgrG